MKPIIIDCKTLCLDGKAPTEDLVKQMYAKLDNYKKLKYETYVEFREDQYWTNALNSDDMIFVVIKELKINERC